MRWHKRALSLLSALGFPSFRAESGCAHCKPPITNSFPLEGGRRGMGVERLGQNAREHSVWPISTPILTFPLQGGRNMRGCLWLSAAVFFLATWSALAVVDVPVPAFTARVIDQTGTLSTEERDALEQKLAQFEASKGSQIAVLIVSTTEPETIEQYSIRVAEQWKLGRKGVDDGALLLVA